ncbi:MAG: SIS domain-containing protein [Firmicutes bacterium]|nr:SIS domain-containing protein [Bacillota bacterium]
MENRSYIENYLTGVSRMADTIDRVAIDRAIQLLYAAWQRGSTVFTCGNGGSAGTAQHLAADLFKCTIVPGQPRLRAVSLVDNLPLLSALTNDDGWEAVYVRQLETLFRPGDVLVVISVHGGTGRDRAGLWSQNLLQAVAYARAQGGTALGLSGFDGGALRELCDVCIVVPDHTTPGVESFHVVLHHLLTFCLAEKIRAHACREETSRCSA